MNTPAMAREIEEALVEHVSLLVPEFLEDPQNREMSAGNAAVCVIGPEGKVVGRVYGADKARGRWCLSIALRKASQVWATGYATGRFEELVYTGKLKEGDFGLNRPDFIGWEGGLPLTLADGTWVAAAFSGFPGERDVAIVREAAKRVGGLEERGARI